jgi:hypothetical protein
VLTIMGNILPRTDLFLCSQRPEVSMSSVIRHIHYRPEVEELSLWFVPDGKRYIYAGVPEALYKALCAAPSQGAFFNRFIRDRFPYRLADVSERQFRRWQAIRSAS